MGRLCGTRRLQQSEQQRTQQRTTSIATIIVITAQCIYKYRELKGHVNSIRDYLTRTFLLYPHHIISSEPAIVLTPIHQHGIQVLSSTAAAPYGYGPASSRFWQLSRGGSAGGRLLQQDMPERRGHRPQRDGEDPRRCTQPRRSTSQAPFPRLLCQGRCAVAVARFQLIIVYVAVTET